MLLDHIRSYYAALNSGDVEAIAAHFTDDAVHYYTRLGPHVGARAIAANTRWAIENLDGQWWMEHGIEQGDEAVIEWTMTWRDPESGEERLNRGTEWFRFRDGLICEVRVITSSFSLADTVPVSMTARKWAIIVFNISGRWATV